MGLDAGVRSIVDQEPGSVCFDQEAYDYQIKTAEMLNEFTKDNGVDIDFKDNPKTYIIDFRIGGYGALHILRRFAAELDGWDGEKYKKAVDLRTSLNTMDGLYDYDYYLGRSAYSHLIDHSDCDGYYLPFDFKKPVFIDKVSIGSSVRLKKELERIKNAVEQKGDGYLKTLWEKMYNLACKSVENKLPIIFH